MPMISGGPVSGTPIERQPVVTLPTRWFPAPTDLANQFTQERREYSFVAANQLRSIIYGYNKVGGDIFAVANNPSSGLFVLGVAIGEGEINAITGTEAYGEGTGAPWITYSHNLGVKSPSADTTLQAALNSSVEVYPFLAWSRVTYNTTLLAGEIETPRFYVQGLKIYDPRENWLPYSEVYTSAYWTFGGTSPTVSSQPGLSQNGTTSAYDYAARWVFGVSGSNQATRDTSGMALTATDSVTVSIDMRVTSGTASVNLSATKITGATTTTSACALTTAWKRFSVTNSGAGTGEGRLQITGIASSGTIEVGRPQIEKNASTFGYKKNAAASLATPIVEYSSNPALELADLKTNTRYGQRVGVNASFTGSGLNDFHVFWDRSGTKGTFEIEIDAAASPDTFKWRFTPTGGTATAYTTGVAITGNQQLLSNGLYIRWDALTGHTLANSWSVTTPTTSVDWASVGMAAEYCDEVLSSGSARFHCHVEIESKSDFVAWEKTIGAYFGGRWQFSDGQWKMVVHKPTTTISAAVTEALIVPGTAKLKRQATSEMPNQLTVSWTDTTDSWKEKRYTVINVETDTSEIREGSVFSMPGIHSEDQAKRTATYLFNGMLADLEVEFEGLLSLCALIPGDRITVQYDPIGLTAATDFTVTSISRSSDLNSVNITATLYNASIWSDTVGATDTVGTFVSISPFDTPPEPGLIRQPDTAYPPKLVWDTPAAYYTDVQYGTSYWTNSGTSSYDGTKVNDGNLAVTAFLVDGAADFVKFDYGSAVLFGALKLYGSHAVSEFDSIGSMRQAAPTLYYSDDDVSYTAITARTTVMVDSGGVRLGWYMDWDSTGAGSHRYWKILFAQWTGGNNVNIQEAQWRRVKASSFPYIKGYELIVGTSTSSPVVLYIPFSTTPVSTNPLELTQYCTRHAITGPYIQFKQDVVIRTVGYNNLRSNGVCMYVQALASPSDAEQTIPVLRSTTGLGKQTGGLAITGQIEGTLGYDFTTAATGTTLEKTSVPSGQSVDIKTTLLNSVQVSATRKDGSIASLQSSHVAPFLKGRYNCSGTVTLNSTTVTDITGATTGSFTPATNMTILVVASWNVKCVTFPAAEFRGRLDVNGSEETAQTRWIATAADHSTTLIGLWRLDLTGGTAYTIKLRGNIASSTGDVDVLADHTGFSLISLGRL